MSGAEDIGNVTHARPSTLSRLLVGSGLRALGAVPSDYERNGDGPLGHSRITAQVEV
jgi:hypothetical protein